MSIHRSDYMLDQGADASTVPKIKQVEVNTISCAFAGLVSKITLPVPRYPAIPPSFNLNWEDRDGVCRSSVT